jgi:hypothetical protein
VVLEISILQALRFLSRGSVKKISSQLMYFGLFIFISEKGSSCLILLLSLRALPGYLQICNGQNTASALHNGLLGAKIRVIYWLFQEYLFTK